MHVDNLIESVLDSMPISSSNKKNPGHIKYDTSNTSKQKPSKKPYQDEILDLSNLLNIEVQFMDVDNKDEYFSILSLHINPHYEIMLINELQLRTLLQEQCSSIFNA
ncbi:hypothetical protein NQ318_000514 [Aromia moschata]|uniref:Uncharacterized protein n=1 Tax=Aromia moschata TaxID=1265417 RepID=A0AAV8YDT7_9CUCU|nr:hypothetical protein NQ318_000514 [Aromia moschata]